MPPILLTYFYPLLYIYPLSYGIVLEVILPSPELLILQTNQVVLGTSQSFYHIHVSSDMVPRRDPHV